MSNPSSADFRVGEIAIYCRPGSLNFGLEVTIVGPLKDWNSLDVQTGERTRVGAYQVDPGPGLIGDYPNVPFIAEPHHLRKKKPPRDDLKLVRWDQCPWQPAQVRA